MSQTDAERLAKTVALVEERNAALAGVQRQRELLDECVEALTLVVDSMHCATDEHITQGVVEDVIWIKHRLRIWSLFEEAVRSLLEEVKRV